MHFFPSEKRVLRKRERTRRLTKNVGKARHVQAHANVEVEDLSYLSDLSERELGNWGTGEQTVCRLSVRRCAVALLRVVVVRDYEASSKARRFEDTEGARKVTRHRRRQVDSQSYRRIERLSRYRKASASSLSYRRSQKSVHFGGIPNAAAAAATICVA